MMIYHFSQALAEFFYLYSPAMEMTPGNVERHVAILYQKKGKFKRKLQMENDYFSL